MTEEQLNAMLCYVKIDCAYFTTQELSKQWGDDWGDKPWEHNAGPPYQPNQLSKTDWQIIEVHFTGPFVTPDDGHWNSPYSVQDINGGAVPWLRSEDYYDEDHEPVDIPAGTTLRDFIQLVQKAGGKLWLPAPDMDLVPDTDPA